MFRTKKSVLYIKLLTFIMAFAMMLNIVNIVKAEEGYYATWKEYKEKSGQPTKTWNNVADAMDKVFAKAKELYAAGDAKGAYESVNHGYYGYYETTGFERNTMGYISGSRKTAVELQFSACKAITKDGGSLESFNTEVDKLGAMIREDAHVLDGTTDQNKGSGSTNSSESSESGAGRSAATATFIACFSIILREGFEAILIVGAIIAYLVKSSGDDEERKKRLVRPVYIGSVLGVVLSFALAWVLDMIKLANTASQEVIEGITALTAVFVLYYVSNWMLSKSETETWTNYIKSKAEKGSKSGSTIALAITAFLAVFREGAEVVLFFQPMLAGDNIHSVWIGFGIGCICLIAVYYAIHVLSIKIPIRPFFTATSILMFIMSISFLGAGIKELIEGDVVGMTSPEWLSFIPSNEFFDVLGVYPILQTLIPQLILLAISIFIFARQSKKNRTVREEMEKKKAEEDAVKAAETKKKEREELTLLVREIVKEVLAEGNNPKPVSDGK